MRSAAGFAPSQVQAEFGRMVLAEQRVGAGLGDLQLEVRARMRHVDGVVRRHLVECAVARRPRSRAPQNARTAGSMASLQRRGAGRRHRQQHQIQILVRVALVAVTVVVIMVVVMVMVMLVLMRMMIVFAARS